MKKAIIAQQYGRKEEFNEELLYELYKEYPFDNAKDIRRFMLRKHGVDVTWNLIANIMNYQIRKYGQCKSSGKHIMRTYNAKSFSKRKKESDKKHNQIETKKFSKNKRRPRNEDLKHN